MSVKSHIDSDQPARNVCAVQSHGQADSGERKQAEITLRSGLEQLEIPLSDRAVECLIRHAELLLKWSQAYNLTGIRNLHDIMVKHVLDSLTITEYVQGPSIIDIGSGAGFPGIPIALAKPECQVTLLDSNSKKIRFLEHSVSQLQLENVEVVCDRIQEFAKRGRKFDTVVVRALGSLNAIAELGFPVLKPNGEILAMKGKYPERELKSLKLPGEFSTHPLSVPGLSADRHLFALRKYALLW